MTVDGYIIETQGLIKVFDKKVRAVDGLNIKVRRGEVFGFLGRNGAGKTTSIKMMVGLLKPTKGKTIIDGEVVKAGSHVVKEKVGVCPQEVTLWDRLTTYENLKIIGELYETPKAKLEKNIDSLLADLQLEDKRNARASALSGGMKRRLEIARGLLTRPKVLFLDEPTIGLDPNSRIRIWNYIKKVNKEGVTIFLTTHYMEEADQLSNTICIIDRGKIIAIGSSETLKQSLGMDVIYLKTDQNEKALQLIEEMKEPKKLRKTPLELLISVENGPQTVPKLIEQIRSNGIEIKSINLKNQSCMMKSICYFPLIRGIILVHT